MELDILTKNDLDQFRIELLKELREVLSHPPQENERQYLRSAEVLKKLGISAGTLQNLRIKGLLKPKKVGGTLFYSNQEIEDLLRNK